MTVVALVACSAVAMPTNDELEKANKEVQASLKTQIAAWQSGSLSDGDLAALMLMYAGKFTDEARHYACLQAAFAAAAHRPLPRSRAAAKPPGRARGGRGCRNRERPWRVDGREVARGVPDGGGAAGHGGVGDFRAKSRTVAASFRGTSFRQGSGEAAGHARQHRQQDQASHRDEGLGRFEDVRVDCACGHCFGRHHVPFFFIARSIADSEWYPEPQRSSCRVHFLSRASDTMCDRRT